MQRLAFVAATVLVVALAWSATALRSTGQQPVLPDPVLQKWEYTIVKVGSGDFLGRFNELGGEGWELVAIEPFTGEKPAQYVFKRRANSI